MPSKELKFVLTGSDQSASKTLKGVGDAGEGATKKIGSAFASLGSKIGGEFGEILTKVGEGIESVGEKGGKGLASKLTIGGAAITALGGTMLALGSKRKQGEQQLKAAVEASGHSYDEYESKIEKAVKAQEKFGHTEGDTTEALMKLTNATQDPAKALANMGLVADLAASKHESLAQAADQVAKVYNGSGKILKQYGITLDSAKASASKLKTAEEQHTSAVQRLSKARERLSDLTEIDTAKSKLSVSEQITLRNAHQAVADAIKEHGAKSAEAAKAEQHLADVQAKLASGSQLTASEQIALRKAHDEVSVAAKQVTSTTAALTAATKANKTQTQDADKALGQLSGKLKGQASAASDSWGGKLKALSSQVADFASKMAEKYGPAVTILGTAFTGAGRALAFYRGHQEKVAAAAAASAAAQEAAATRVTVAATQVELAQAEVVAAEQAAADAAGLSASEQSAAQARVVAAHEAAAAAVAESDAAIIAEDEAAGAASSLALGPIGLAVAGVVGAVALATKGFGLFGSKAKEQVKPTQELTNAILSDGDAFGKLTRAQVVNTLNSKGAYEAGVKLGVSQKTLTDAAMGNQAAIQAVNKAVTTNTRGLSGYQLANSKTGMAALKLKDAVGSVTEELRVNQRAADNVQRANGKLTSSELRAVAAETKHLVSLGANRKQAGALATAYQRLPAAKRTKVTLDDYASARLASVKRNLDAIRSKSVSVNVNYTSTGRAGPGAVGKFYASGTDYFPGGATHIAEREPEAVYLPRGTTIKPLSKMTGGGGTQTINLQIVAPHIWGGDEATLARYLAGMFARTGIKLPPSAVR